MFRKRRSSKKLDIELYAKFRENHPDVGPGTSSPIHLSVTESERIIRSTREGEADAQHGDKNGTPTSGVPWLSSGNITSVPPTPSMSDEYASSQTLVAQRQNAEEFDQSIIIGSSQPLSPTSEHHMWSDFILAKHMFTPETFQSCNFQDFPSPLMQQASFPETLASASPDLQPPSPLANEDFLDSNSVDLVEPQCEIVDTFGQAYGTKESAPSSRPSNGLRFHHKLDAPPALMPKGSGGSSVTYLNKGSDCSIAVEDTLRAASNPGKKVYCTSVQVRFDAEQQRQQPLIYWQLWEQHRNGDEVRSVEGKSLAIEYVGPQKFDHQDHEANLQAVHSDGFSLMWSADHKDMRQFPVKIRLNFRSTDFSHSKGIAGAAMQLCIKTEEISTGSVKSLIPNPGMSFCRIKSFRTHGAERKNANDMAIAGKRIRRLKQQLVQSQTRQTPKDKRLDKDKSKMPRYPGQRRTHEDGLVCKIKNLELNCTSSQAYTLFDHRGEEQQNCDWPPSPHENKIPESLEAGPTLSSWTRQSGAVLMSSIPKHSMSSWQLIQNSTLPRYDESQQEMLTQGFPDRLKSSSMKHRGIKVACFYIRPVGFKHISQCDRYIAVYLSERTACDLTRSIAEAVSIDPGKVGQTVWSTGKGLTILVDDDVVANMMEGQQMLVEAKCTAPGARSERESSHDPGDEVHYHEHGVSQGNGEVLEFNLVF